MAKSFTKLHGQVVARPGANGRLAVLREETLVEIGLFELRRSRDWSQVELAERLGVSQSAVSQLEGGGDLRLSTLRAYVEGLGGELVVSAVFDGDAQVALQV